MATHVSPRPDRRWRRKRHYSRPSASSGYSARRHPARPPRGRNWSTCSTLDQLRIIDRIEKQGADFSRRSARSSFPDSGCTPGSRFFVSLHMRVASLKIDIGPAQRTSRRSPQAVPENNQDQVASRWPWRLLQAALIRRSTSCSVRHSRVRSVTFGLAAGPELSALLLASDTRCSARFAMTFFPRLQSTICKHCCAMPRLKACEAPGLRANLPSRKFQAGPNHRPSTSGVRSVPRCHWTVKRIGARYAAPRILRAKRCQTPLSAGRRAVSRPSLMSDAE